MADDTENKNDAGEEGDAYDYDENEANSADNPGEAPAVDSNDAVEPTTIAPSQQPPSDDNNADDSANVPDADAGAAGAAATDAAAQDDFEGDYDDEPLPDVTVKLYIDELPEGAVTDAVNALTDEYGRPIDGWTRMIEDYSTTIAQDLAGGLEGNGTTTGKQGWLGSWTWSKSLLVGLIALSIIGIIIAVVCFVTGKKWKRNSPPQGSAGETSTVKKAVKTKGLTPETKYTSVPTDV